MDLTSPLPIPDAIRLQHARRKSLQEPPSSSTNREQVQPASPEVISSLISSLSVISSTTNDLFEHTNGVQSTSASPTSFQSLGNFSFSPRNSYRSSAGSFGVDYGAYDPPPLQNLIEEDSLDELAATPPVVRTSKPPSGLSSLTAQKSPQRESGAFNSFLRGGSRPSSKGSDRDDASSIGNLSIEPGPVQQSPDLRRRGSGDSWGKKQGRNQKGLMYMSSKERLREREHDRKRISAGTIGSSANGLGLDRKFFPNFDSETFLAENAIGEESEEGTPAKRQSADMSVCSDAPGTPNNLAIPARDSSLRKSKRTSNRSSRQSGKQVQKLDDVIQEAEELIRRRARQEKNDSSEAISRITEPLDSLEIPLPTKTETVSSAKGSIDRLLVEDENEGAPSPSVAQRKTRQSVDSNRTSNQKRKSAKNVPESIEPLQTKGNGSRLRRLSAPLSPKHSRTSSNPLSRVGSPEPDRTFQINVEERTNSLDSIDEAVESYLRSPRLSQKIRHPQTGRTISFSEVGDSEGYAVFCCVGMGLTRYITAFYDELALTLKLRLITPDRPGVGDSEPYTDGTATPLSWPDDVYAICQALKITKFSILAHSAGAIYALATALRMPQHIRGRIHLLAPWIPPSQMNVFGGQVALLPPTNSIPTSQRILRALPTPILKAANSSFMSATSSSITSSLPKQRRSKRKSAGRDTPATGRGTATPGLDKENNPNSSIYPDPSDPASVERALKDSKDPNHENAVLAAAASTLAEKERQQTYDSRLTHAIWDLATQGANPAVDLLVCLERRHTIGFRYVDITRALVIHHGSKDTRVPVENVRWLGKTMKRCEVRVLEGEGHGLMASATVMGGILMEISREWEDWMKVTGSTGGLRNDGSARRVLKERPSLGAFR